MMATAVSNNSWNARAYFPQSPATLPKEIIEKQLFSYTNETDMCKFCQVSKIWNEFVNGYLLEKLNGLSILVMLAVNHPFLITSKTFSKVPVLFGQKAQS